MSSPESVKLQKQIDVLTPPLDGELEGVRIDFQLSLRQNARVPSEALEDSSLLIEGSAFTVFNYGDGSAAAYVPDLADGDYEAELLGNPARYRIEQLTVADGRGRAVLQPILKQPVKLQLMAEENGEYTPFSGRVFLLTRSDNGTIQTYMTAEADEGGLIVIPSDPGRKYLIDPSPETMRVKYFDWRIVDDWAELADATRRTVVQRNYNVILQADRGSSEALVTAQGEEAEAFAAARFNTSGRAYLNLQPGTYELNGANFVFDPPLLTIASGTGIQSFAVTRTLQKTAEIRSPVLRVDVDLPADDPRNEGAVVVLAPDGSANSFLLDENFPIDILSPMPGRYMFQYRGHPERDGFLEINIGKEGGTVLIPTFRGPRNIWNFKVESIVSLILFDSNFISRVRLLPGDIALVAPEGMARVKIELAGGARLVTPTLNTRLDQVVEYSPDVPLRTDQPVILVYPDGWIVELEPGLHMVRSGQPDVYYENPLLAGSLLTLRRYCVTTATTMLDLAGGTPVSRLEIDRIGSPDYQAINLPAPSLRSVTEVQEIGRFYSELLREQLGVGSLMDLAALDTANVSLPKGLGRKRLLAWVRQADLLLNFGGRLNSNDIEILYNAGVNDAASLMGMEGARLAFAIGSAMQKTKLPADFSSKRLFRLRPDLNSFLEEGR